MSAAAALTFICPACGFVLVEEPQRDPIHCRRCESDITVEIFPAFYRTHEPSRHQTVVSDEASCFFHADRVAAVACSRCGRFLCPFCRIRWATEDLCPSCVEAANSGQRAKQLASSRFHFDTLALALSTLPILTGFLSMLSAPVALGLALFTFNRECSIAPRTKIRFILAILFSVATIAGWIAFFVYALRGASGEVAVPLD